MDWYRSSGDAESDHMEKNLDQISMHGDGDPKLFFDRAEGNLSVLSKPDSQTSYGWVVRLITRSLPSEF